MRSRETSSATGGSSRRHLAGASSPLGATRVVDSRSPSLLEGQRVLGLVPMGTHFTVSPAAHQFGFVDRASHRAGLARAYNLYLTVDGEGDETALVLRPLFVTSVLLDLLLSEQEPARVRSVFVTSASSKTAYGLAHLLGERPVQTIGLTSAGRLAWVESLELYDTVLAYGDLRGLRRQGGTVLVDFAGDRAILRRVHEQLGETLTRSILVGFTHRQAEADEAPLTGPAPEFFFAPAEIARRGREVGQTVRSGLGAVCSHLRANGAHQASHLKRSTRPPLPGAARGQGRPRCRLRRQPRPHPMEIVTTAYSLAGTVQIPAGPRGVYSGQIGSRQRQTACTARGHEPGSSFLPGSSSRPR